MESDTSGRVHSFHVFSGDVVHMFGHCQYLYQHCVMKAENGPTVMGTTDAARRSSSTQRRTSEEQKPEYPTPGNGPRISLVFKQSAAFYDLSDAQRPNPNDQRKGTDEHRRGEILRQLQRPLPGCGGSVSDTPSGPYWWAAGNLRNTARARLPFPLGFACFFVGLS